MHESLRASYQSRLALLDLLRRNLESETLEVLADLPNKDRISFRVKSVDSFMKKALDPENDPPYQEPLVEIEDQVAGRVIVFFLDDIDPIKDALSRTYRTLEYAHRKPAVDAEFSYESHHLKCIIPPLLKPDGWERLGDDAPQTFELQIRTIFMHAYAEPQHDFAYKSTGNLPGHIKRQLAWIAASAWGADRAYSEFWKWHLDNQNNGA